MKGIDFSLPRPRSPKGHIVNGQCTASKKGTADPCRRARYCSSTSFAVAIFEAPQPRQEGQAEQIFAQGFVRQDKRGDVAHFQIADLNKIEMR
jgi:hypothetical protein